MLLEELREKIVFLGNLLVRDGLAHIGQGNISAIDRTQNLIAITPSAVPYEDRMKQDICVVDREGKLVEGSWKPTSEIALHLVFYRERKDIQAVLHTHPPYTTVFGIIEEIELPMVLNEAAMVLGAPLPFAPYARPGTEKLAWLTCKAAGSGFGVIMAHHGLVTLGETLDNAYAATLAAEATARTVIMARSMGAKVKKLNSIEVKNLRELYTQYRAERK